MNIWQRINEVKKAIAYIKKDREITGGGSYMAISHDAVTAATRQHFIDNGVLIVPAELTSACVDSGMVTGKGNPIIRFEAKYRVDFLNIDEPEQKVSVEFTAHALDQGDKAPGKAHSYATKYAVLKVLQLETGEEEESREAAKPKKLADVPIPMAPVTPNAGAGEDLTDEERKACDKVFSRMVDFMDAKNVQGAHDAFYAIEGTDEKLYVWDKLQPHSKFRREIKKLHETGLLATQP